MSEPASGAESTRDIAAQRRAEDPPRASADHTSFETPSWLGPDRHRDPGRAGRIPAQVAPTHDALAPTAASVEPTALLDTGHWKASSPGRVVGGVLLALSATATVAAGVAAAGDPSGDNGITLGICAAVTLGLWALMASTRPMEVDLSGSMLTVKHHGTQDTFDLADPFQRVEVRGAVGSPTWSMSLERRDGTSVAVGSKTVRASQLHPTVLYHRARAEQRRAERDERFRT